MSSAKTLYLYGKPSVSIFHENLYGITSPLYMIILFLIHNTNLEIFEESIRLINIIFGIGCITMIYLILLKFGTNEMYNKFIALGGSLFFSFHAQTSFITNSGMETNLYIFIFILNIFIYLYIFIKLI